jgi:hypothetical protein
LNIQEIIAELKSETVRLGQAIAALEGMDSRPRAPKSLPNTKISTSTNNNTSLLSSAELSAKRSEAMKKSWAARRKNA